MVELVSAALDPEVVVPVVEPVAVEPAAVEPVAVEPVAVDRPVPEPVDAEPLEVVPLEVAPLEAAPLPVEERDSSVELLRSALLPAEFVPLEAEPSHRPAPPDDPADRAVVSVAVCAGSVPEESELSDPSSTVDTTVVGSPPSCSRTYDR